MLLMKLKNEEKFAFLALAYHIANIDGEFDIQEIETIDEYCAEMGIDNIDYGEENFNLEENLLQIKSKKSQTIVLLELLILVHSDDKFVQLEDRIIEEIALFFNISLSQLEVYSQWGKMCSSLSYQGKLFIENKY